MNKKVLIGVIIAVIGLAAIGVATAFIMNSKDDKSTNNNDTNQEASDSEATGETNQVNDKTLVAYYSAQNHTRNVAEQIARELDADTFEIIPQEIYTSEDLNWTTDGSRVSREHDDESLRDVALVSTTVPNWSEYDTVLIGYPIWWGIAAWPINNFVKENDFSGKTVIPFCTSASSGLGQSGELLEIMAGTGDWQTGHRFSSNPSSSEIETWAESIK